MIVRPLLALRVSLGSLSDGHQNPPIHPGSRGDAYQEFHPDQLPIQTLQVDRIVKTGTIFRILRSTSHLFPIG